MFIEFYHSVTYILKHTWPAINLHFAPKPGIIGSIPHILVFYSTDMCIVSKNCMFFLRMYYPSWQTSWSVFCDFNIIIFFRNESFLEPYLQDLNTRQSPQVGAPSPSPPPLRAIAPPSVILPSSRSISRESLISSNGGSDASSERSEEEGTFNH